MTPATARKLFVNLPVRDLERTVAFFTALGFTFNKQFTDASATCMLVGADAYVMLLVESRFKSFTRKQPCDTRTHTEALFSISAGSRAEVDELVRKALAAGGTTPDEPQDLGFMYDWSFQDLDGHNWGVFWMDPAHVQAG